MIHLFRPSYLISGDHSSLGLRSSPRVIGDTPSCRIMIVTTATEEAEVVAAER